MMSKYILFKVALVSVFFFAVSVSWASSSSENARCEVRGEESRKVFINCPVEFGPGDILKEVLSIREQKAKNEQAEISIYVFAGERTPASTQEMLRIPERNIQKIQTAFYSNYPNGETDYFCKKGGRLQKCREFLSKR